MQILIVNKQFNVRKKVTGLKENSERRKALGLFLVRLDNRCLIIASDGDGSCNRVLRTRYTMLGMCI